MMLITLLELLSAFLAVVSSLFVRLGRRKGPLTAATAACASRLFQGRYMLDLISLSYFYPAECMCFCTVELLGAVA